MDVNHDYNAAFKGISVKLKKRFYRKPNVSDAIEEYTALSRQLESEECFGLAAYCMQQIAKSYHSVGNSVSESAALQQAAKLYLNSEITSTVEAGTITFNEDLQSAMSMYEETIRLHCDQNERQLAAKICLELADLLAQKFERYFESLPYYERAIALFSPLTPLEQPNILQIMLIQLKLAALKVFTCDYTGALNIYTDIVNNITAKCGLPAANAPNSSASGKSQQASARTTSMSHQQQQQSGSFILNPMDQLPGGKSSPSVLNKPIGIYSDFLVQCEISKLLLLIYLKPTKMKAEHSLTLEVFSWFQSLSDSPANNNNNSHHNIASTYLPIQCIDKDLFILLQSFLMACQSNDNDSKVLYTLQTELWPHLNEVQNHVLNLITDQLLNSSYTDDLLTEQFN